MWGREREWEGETGESKRETDTETDREKDMLGAGGMLHTYIFYIFL